MTRSRSTAPWTLLLASSLASCATSHRALPAVVAAPSSVRPAVAAAAPASAPVHDGSLDEQLLAVARTYRSWGRVDEHTRWAQTRCALPPTPARLSAAPAGPHAMKVYWLYARDPGAYLEARPATTQVVVKESWSHRPVTAAEAQGGLADLAARTSDGQLVTADQPTGLYVMMAVADDDPRGDRGWAYGTVAPDGTVTSAGRVATCMGCHEEAGAGRLFGLRRPG